MNQRLKRVLAQTFPRESSKKPRHRQTGDGFTNRTHELLPVEVGPRDVPETWEIAGARDPPTREVPELRREGLGAMRSEDLREPGAFRHGERNQIARRERSRPGPLSI